MTPSAIIAAAESERATWPQWLLCVRGGTASDGGADLVVRTDCVSLRVRLAESQRHAQELRRATRPGSGGVVVTPPGLTGEQAWRRVFRKADKIHSQFWCRREKKFRPVKQVNRKRQAADEVRFFDSPERREWIKRQPCAVTGQPPPCDNAHVGRTRGSRLAKPEEIVPMKREVHNDHGTMTTYKFMKRYGKSPADLLRLAAEADAAWQRELQRRSQR